MEVLSNAVVGNVDDATLVVVVFSRAEIVVCREVLLVSVHTIIVVLGGKLVDVAFDDERFFSPVILVVVFSVFAGDVVAIPVAFAGRAFDVVTAVMDVVAAVVICAFTTYGREDVDKNILLIFASLPHIYPTAIIILP